jgi:hypothetical protein
MSEVQAQPFPPLPAAGKNTNNRKGKGAAAAKKNGMSPSTLNTLDALPPMPTAAAKPVAAAAAAAPIAPPAPQMSPDVVVVAPTTAAAVAEEAKATTVGGTATKAKPLPCGTCGKNRVQTMFSNRERDRAEAGNKALCRPCAAFNNVLRRYSMTRADFQKRLDAQQNACGVCHVKFTGKILPHIDTWSGATGAMRGIVCADCDALMAHLGDTLDGCLAPVLYMCEAAAKTAENKDAFTKLLAELHQIRALATPVAAAAVVATNGKVDDDDNNNGDDDLAL